MGKRIICTRRYNYISGKNQENVCGCGIFRNGADILCISYKVAKPYLTTQL